MESHEHIHNLRLMLIELQENKLTKKQIKCRKATLQLCDSLDETIASITSRDIPESMISEVIEEGLHKSLQTSLDDFEEELGDLGKVYKKFLETI
jgi:hypothetical protein